MGLKIIKSHVSSEAKITLFPSISRYFHELTDPIEESTTVRIDVERFIDDSGNTTKVFPPLNMKNGYFNVYLDGISQMDDLFAYTAGEAGIGHLIMTVPEGSSLEAGTTIVLEVINFEPTIKTGNQRRDS